MNPVHWTNRPRLQAVNCANNSTIQNIMAFVATDSGGGNFKRVPAGVHIGRCYSLIDLGTQLTTGQYGDKLQHKIRIGWELFGEDEDGAPLTVDIDGQDLPLTISKSYTVSLHEKSGLRRDLAAWRGRDFTEDEAKAFDVSKLLGAYCMVNCTFAESGGKTYTNVGGLTPLPAALKNTKPAPVHEPVVFDLDAPDMALFRGFHEKLQDAIKRSPEWAQFAKKSSLSPAGGSVDESESDIPF
ncbi:MAG: hypothetical protein WBI20_14985 [Burkholderiaceae bacterium]